MGNKGRHRFVPDHLWFDPTPVFDQEVTNSFFYVYVRCHSRNHAFDSIPLSRVFPLYRKIAFQKAKKMFRCSVRSKQTHKVAVAITCHMAVCFPTNPQLQLASIDGLLLG